MEKTLSEQLIEQAQLGDAEKIRSLVSLGADVEIKDKYGRTALMRAAQKKSCRLRNRPYRGGR